MIAPSLNAAARHARRCLLYAPAAPALASPDFLLPRPLSLLYAMPPPFTPLSRPQCRRCTPFFFVFTSKT